MVDDAVEIEYQLTKDDYIKFWVDYGMINYKGLALKDILRIFTKTFVSALFIQGVMFTCIALLRENPSFYSLLNFMQFATFVFFSSLGISIISFIIICIPRIIFYKKIYNRHITKKCRKIASQNGTVILTPIKLILNSKEVEIREEFSSKKYDWKIFNSIQLNNSNLWLTGINIYIFVPARFFISEAERQNTFELIQKWFQDPKLKKDLVDV